MPYASDRDRDPHLLELSGAPWPVPPLNLFCTSGYKPGVFELSWDDPSSLALNSRFNVIGVNLYRSFDSEFGPFERVTDLPVGAIFWRDMTNNVLVIDEAVADDQWILRGVEGVGLRGRRYIFRTSRYPIVQPGSQDIATVNPNDVRVMIDGVEARVLGVSGHYGEIELDPVMWPSVEKQNLTTPVLPAQGSDVRVSYRYNSSLLRTDLQQRVFYRVTTVALTSEGQTLVETPLERAAATSSAEIEKLDWIWREAVRRNRWILDQGGERVKVLLRKHVGRACPCIPNPTYKQPINDCEYCYGTGIVGGYEGAYDLVIAPDDSERRIAQRDVGRTVEHLSDVWTGPTPLLSMRDLVVKIDGSRYSVGAVHRPSNRGMILQQHFQIGILDEKDFRYTIPIDTPSGASRVVPAIPPNNSPAGVTDKPGIPGEVELRGRDVVWGNITY